MGCQVAASLAAMVVNELFVFPLKALPIGLRSLVYRWRKKAGEADFLVLCGAFKPWRFTCDGIRRID